MTLIKTSLLNAIAVGVKMLTLLGLNKILAVYVGPAGYAALGQFQNAVQMISMSHHAFHLFVVRVQQRAASQVHLKAAGIDTLIHYPIPPHQQQAYKAYSGLQLPLTEAIHQEVVSLPIGPTMPLPQVQAVIAACNAYSG